MSPSPLELLHHIREESVYLAEESSRLTRDTFRADPTLRRAFVRSLEIIGEAVKKLPDSVRRQGPAPDGDRWRGCVMA